MKLQNQLYFICLSLFLILGYVGTGYSQEGFQLPTSSKKDRISFQFINNLVIIPVEVNGKELSFLLDTGVNYTLLFSLSETDSLELKSVSSVKIKGLGDGGDIDALKSIGNTVKVGTAIDKSHVLYVIFDERINFSPRMGIPVHGVMGYDLYKSFVVKTDYVNELVTLYDPSLYKYKRCRSCETFDIALVGKKPYIKNKIRFNGRSKDVNLLVDTGASDALWLFEEPSNFKIDSTAYFEDFLGLGLSGNVHGKRAKLASLSLGKFDLEDVNVSYPDSLALRNLKTGSGRDGTLGSDVLKRFTMTIDYGSRKIVLRKNKFFNDSFHYDMSGLTIEHDGLIPASRAEDGKGNTYTFSSQDRRDTSGKLSFNLEPVFSFYLAPKYVIAEVRNNSPAAIAGLQSGDELISINHKAAYRYSLEEITALFSSKDGKRIVLVISRKGRIIKSRFLLKRVL